MSLRQIIDNVQEQVGRPEERWQAEWTLCQVLCWDEDNNAPGRPVPINIYKNERGLLDGKVLCVIRRSNHFPPRYEVSVGESRNTLQFLSNRVGTQISDDFTVDIFGFMPAKAAALLTAAQTYIDQDLLDFRYDNEDRIRRRIERNKREAQERHSGNKSHGQRAGKTERDRQKKLQNRAVKS